MISGFRDTQRKSPVANKRSGWLSVSLCLAFFLTAGWPGPGAAPGNPMQERRAAPPRLKEIIVVYKTHFDIGYTALPSEVLERYRTSMIDKALGLVDASRSLPPEQQFVWTIPGWPLTEILWKGQAPERKRRILEALRDGRFVNHALPFTTHTESLDLEDLVRGMTFSSSLVRSLSLELPRDAKMTDVPCHSWVLPTILKHAGVDFLHLGSNSMSSGPELPSFGKVEKLDDGREMDQRQAVFWWEGPDGSRVLTMYSRRYGSSLAPPSDWPFSTWLALIHTGDNAGPPAPASVQKLLDEARSTLPGVRVRLGRLSDFSDALLKENPQLPVVRGDMPDPWIHGVMSMPAETAIVRNARPRIGALEALNTMLAAWIGQEDASPAIAQAYEQSLLYGEHTWGYDAKKFPRSYCAKWQADRSAGAFNRLEKSWEEHREYGRRTAALIAPELERNLKALSAGVRADGRRIAVFNSLPWERGGLVEAAYGGAPPRALKDAKSGAFVPVEADGAKIRFIAANVPPMGYRTYLFTDHAATVKPELSADKTARTIENRFFRITLDPEAGRIASLLDKTSGRELVEANAVVGCAQYQHERFSADDMEKYVRSYTRGNGKAIWGDFGKPGMPAALDLPHQTASPRKMKLDLTRDAVSVSARMEAGPADTLAWATSLVVMGNKLRAVDRWFLGIPRVLVEHSQLQAFRFPGAPVARGARSAARRSCGRARR